MSVATGPRLHDCRDAFSDALLELMAADQRVVAVVNDSLGSTKVSRVHDAFPERVVNVGIAEQNMVGIGAGLANGGRIPFVCGASPFLTARALEQIKVDAAYSGANVKLVGVSSGVAYGELGPTHHSIEDVAWMRAIDGLLVVVPADPLETRQAIRAAYELEGPDLRAHEPDAGAGCPPARPRASPRAGRPPARRGRREPHRQRHHGQPRPGGRRSCWPWRVSRRAC